MKMGVTVILTLYFATVILFTTPWLKKPTLSPSNVFNDSTRRDQLQRSPPVNTDNNNLGPTLAFYTTTNVTNSIDNHRV